jgi:hypothetical protein
VSGHFMLLVLACRTRRKTVGSAGQKAEGT